MNGLFAAALICTAAVSFFLGTVIGSRDSTMKFVLSLIALALLASPCQAQCKTVFHRKVVAVQAVAVVPAPIVLYQSASYSRFDAELKEAARLGAQEALAQFYADAEAALAEGATDYVPPHQRNLELPATPHRQYLQANCLQCHNGPSGQGGIDLSGDDPFALAMAADAVRAGRMPKGSGKSNPEAAELLRKAALAASRAPAESP